MTSIPPAASAPRHHSDPRPALGPAECGEQRDPAAELRPLPSRPRSAARSSGRWRRSASTPGIPQELARPARHSSASSRATMTARPASPSRHRPLDDRSPAPLGPMEDSARPRPPETTAGRPAVTTSRRIHRREVGRGIPRRTGHARQPGVPPEERRETQAGQHYVDRRRSAPPLVICSIKIASMSRTIARSRLASVSSACVLSQEVRQQVEGEGVGRADDDLRIECRAVLGTDRPVIGHQRARHPVQPQRLRPTTDEVIGRHGVDAHDVDLEALPGCFDGRGPHDALGPFTVVDLEDHPAARQEGRRRDDTVRVDRVCRHVLLPFGPSGGTTR